MSSSFAYVSRRFIASTVRVRDIVIRPEKLRVNIEPILFVVD